MKFSVNWLREFVDLPENLDELAELLTLSGIEIEAIEQRGANFNKVIVAQITASSRHPNADRLTVCEVDDGSGLKHQIVCGATNYKVGDKVPLALPGAVLSNGLKIKESKLRGVDSEGMLCSAIELGLGQDAAGLLILSPAARIGAAIGDIFPSDTILDVEITPNRGDLLSHFGLAREIAALSGKPLRDPTERSAKKSPPEKKQGIKILALDECPFYSARRIENVKVGPSPDWLRARIESVGIRAINNVVDISNFVMLELGQPTHAFDADKLKGVVYVRLAYEGEKFLALDGKNYVMTPSDLMIADEAQPIGIGGVMGGEETGVTDSTRNILLESAFFSPPSIRRTARRLNLPSDASYRFERGVDPGMVLRASQRATELMREIAGGEPAPDIWVAGKLPAAPPDIRLRYERCDALLGTTVAPKRADEILQGFGLNKVSQGDGKGASEATWRVPSYRRDLEREVDLIEEVVRAHGVQTIAGRDRSRFTPASAADHAHDAEVKLRENLAARGLNEARTSKLIPKTAPAFNEDALELRNPLTEDHVALRPSLIGGLLEVLARNIRNGAERVAIFEIGRVFLPGDGKEERHIGIVLWGNTAGHVHWRGEKKRRIDFYDLKGAVDPLLPDNSNFRRASHDDHLSLAAELVVDGKVIGMVGQLSSALSAKLDAVGPVFVAELAADVAMKKMQSAKMFHEFGRFPAVVRDIAMIVPETLTHEKIYNEILRVAEPLLERVRLFDVFSGSEAQHLGTGRKSLAYTLTYRDKSRTLTGEEVTAAHARIRERLQNELGAELREQVL